MNFFKKIKSDIDEYVAFKKRMKEDAVQFAQDMKRSQERREKEKRTRLNEIASRIYQQNQEEIVQLSKEKLRIDEFSAEEVAIFYYSLNDELRSTFLNYFNDEEKEVILYQVDQLKPYLESALKPVLQKIFNEADRRKIEKERMK